MKLDKESRRTEHCRPATIVIIEANNCKPSTSVSNIALFKKNHSQVEFHLGIQK